jgi:hypothetical protein
MEVSGQLHASAALPPGERAPGTHWTGGRVGPTAALQAEAKRINPCPSQESNPGRPGRSLVTVLTDIPYKMQLFSEQLARSALCHK